MNKRKYKVIPEKLDEYFEDLLTLEDWIPSEIKVFLPNERIFALQSGDKVKNKELWWKRLMEHQRENNSMGFLDYINWEIETFIKKYPYFSPLFVEIE